MYVYDKVRGEAENKAVNYSERVVENMRRKKKLQLTRPIEINLPSIVKLNK
jgi:hypothetical protein